MLLRASNLARVGRGIAPASPRSCSTNGSPPIDSVPGATSTHHHRNRLNPLAKQRLGRRCDAKPARTAKTDTIDNQRLLFNYLQSVLEQVRYDPRRLHGVTLNRETERAFSQGDRIQFTAPNREQRIVNREVATIEKIDDSGNLQLRLDAGCTVAFNIKENPHLDHGYAGTSHSSQGQTADRVLIHIDTERGWRKARESPLGV
jgi:ATP-dependent exoDNAse (exonuclease V) alpha subunit